LEHEKDNEEWIKCVSSEFLFEDEDESSGVIMSGLFNGVVNIYDSQFELKHS